MLIFWGDGSQQAKDLVSQIQVRSTENFNWTFIFILAVVFYVYWTVSSLVSQQPIDYIHSSDRCVLGAFHDVLPGRYNLFQNAAEG